MTGHCPLFSLPSENPSYNSTLVFLAKLILLFCTFLHYLFSVMVYILSRTEKFSKLATEDNVIEDSAKRNET